MDCWWGWGRRRGDAARRPCSFRVDVISSECPYRCVSTRIDESLECAGSTQWNVSVELCWIQTTCMNNSRITRSTSLAMKMRFLYISPCRYHEHLHLPPNPQTPKRPEARWPQSPDRIRQGYARYSPMATFDFLGNHL